MPFPCLPPKTIIKMHKFCNINLSTPTIVIALRMCYNSDKVKSGELNLKVERIPTPIPENGWDAEWNQDIHTAKSSFHRKKRYILEQKNKTRNKKKETGGEQEWQAVVSQEPTTIILIPRDA